MIVIVELEIVVLMPVCDVEVNHGHESDLLVVDDVHPEEAVLLVDSMTADLFEQGGGPVGVSVAPGSRELFRAPGVAHLEESVAS